MTSDELHEFLASPNIGSVTLSVTQMGNAMVSVSRMQPGNPPSFAADHHWGPTLTDALHTAVTAVPPTRKAPEPVDVRKPDLLDDLL